MTRAVLLELVAIGIGVLIAAIMVWRIWSRSSERYVPPTKTDPRKVLPVDLSDRDR
jgi:hypothetical protein